MKRKILSVLSVLMAVLVSTAALSACGKAPAGDNSGGSGESVSTEQGGEPSVSESAAESEQSEPSQGESSTKTVEPPDENGRFAPMDGEAWRKNYGEIYGEPTIKDGDANLAPFMDDADSVAKLKESYPKIDDWKIVFEKDFYETGLGYDSEKKNFVKTDLPVRFVILSTEQGNGFDIVFASSKHMVDYDYNYDEENEKDYAVPYMDVRFDTCTADKSKIEGIDFSGAQLYRSRDLYTENIPYLIWLPKTSSVFCMEDNYPSLIRFEGATEPVKMTSTLAAKYWRKTPGDVKFPVPESRKSDHLITTANDASSRDWALWYYSAADGTARMFEGLESFFTLSNGFVSDTCMEAFIGTDKGIFRYYDFSDGADPTKCIWTLSGNGGGLLGGKVTDAANYSSIMDKNDNDRLVILYAEDESKMYWICSYTLEGGVQTNFCLDLSSKGYIGSCSVRSGVAYFSYHRGKERVNYAVDVRPDKDHTLQANAW